MSLKTLEKSLQVLEFFTSEKPKWKLRELARELEINHSIVYRILSTFERSGYIYQNKDSKEYELGLKFLEFSRIMDDNLKITELLEPIMSELTNQSEESVVFTILDDFYGLYFKITESHQNVRFAESIGRRSPLYIGASHRTILAFLPVEVQEEVYQMGKESGHPATSDHQSFFDKLQVIRDQGWLFSSGETFPDVSAVSVPIFDSQHRVIASLSIAGPSYRLTESAATEKIDLLFESKYKVQRFSSKLSFPVKRPEMLATESH
ncbi:IclR family transcriptional regulator [Salipaludibacillus daqingensis]|uniref:IclR family transcriptional regulator n=1 Tax=Salipaludibacillus daqingensis TaxID=3041001 RepID=UPI002473C1B9|nr:IclR family transcriptional regulator [Salipaludibacillus daqingensis]